MHAAVIVGTDAIVGSRLALRLLEDVNRSVLWVVGPGLTRYSCLVDTALRQVAPEHTASRIARLTITAALSDIREPDLSIIDQIWILASPPAAHEGRAPTTSEALVAWLGRVTCSINLVWRGGTEPSDFALVLPETSNVTNIGRFRLPWLLDEELSALGADDDALTLVAPIDDAIQSVRKRLAEYFDWHALHVHASPEAILPFGRSTDAITEMVAMASARTGGSVEYNVRAGFCVTVADVCDAVTDAYDVTLAAGGDNAVVGAVDRALAAGLGPTHPFIATLSGVPPLDAAAPPAPSATDIVARARDLLAERRRLHEIQIRETVDRLDWRTVPVSDGTLRYGVAGGIGPPLIILSAIGQGVEYWFPLIHRLAPHHRIFIWEPRGVEPPTGPHVGLAEHVSDVEAVMAAEHLDRSCLIGWCTGPQVAVECYRRWPSRIAALVFLNCALDLPEHPELKTQYSHDLESLCRTVVSQPRTAPMIARSLARMSEPDPAALMALDAARAADAVVRLTRNDLRSHVLRPFRSADTMLRYAKQLLDLLSHPTVAHAASVSVPVLSVACEHDPVVTAERVRRVAQRFPSNRHIDVMGTHHALYEQPDLVGNLILSFTAETFAKSPQVS